MNRWTAIAWALVTLDTSRRCRRGRALPPERRRRLGDLAEGGRRIAPPSERRADGSGHRFGAVVALLGAIVTGTFGLPGVVVVAFGVVAKVRRDRRIAARRRGTEIRALAELLELVALGARGGLPLSVAVERAAAGMSPPDRFRPRRDGDPAGELIVELRRHATLTEALDAWGAAGVDERRRHVADLLRDAGRAGAGVAARLERLAQHLRHELRHERLAAARRLPVSLLPPLVCCTLPSFVALCVVPTLVVGIGRISPLTAIP